MYYWRVFLWENGHKTVDYTKYCVAPIFIEDKLDETLDSGEVVLKAMPIATRNAFPPKTKFRLERYTKEDYTDEPRKWDLVVEHDDVEEYEGCPEICTHRVNLIEASVITQNMHVDNIALTYELQDVDLNYKTIKEDNSILGQDGVRAPQGGGSHSEVACETCERNVNTIDGSTYKFINSYEYAWDESSLQKIKGLLQFLDATEAHEINIDIPRLMCRGCYENGIFSDLFEMNTVTRIWRKKTLNGQPISGAKDLIFERYSGATSITPNDNDLYYSDGQTAAFTTAITGTQRWVAYGLNLFRLSRFRTHLPVVATASSSYSDKTAIFTTTALSEAEVAAGYGYIYEIECYANPTNQSGMIEYYYNSVYCKEHHETSGGVVFEHTFTERSPIITPATGVYVKASFNCKDMSEEAEGGTFLMKGVKYSCYELLQKALLTIDTQILNNSVTGIENLTDRFPITLSPDWVTRLKTAKMQETIFEGKNLWEVLLQIGYYLHAIPYLEFADDGTDRFVLSFRQLGDTKQKADTSRKITVFNSRNLSDYFTQYDSYVTNLFSPQNEVDEWLVAKTSDSTYLVSNDVAEIKTSRPILEVIEFDITYNGKTVDALQYIFEESVYQILTSDSPVKVKPAKGNALYYTLGSNTITGLSYVPPAENPGTYFYALQEICRRLFGLSKPEELKFNDLIFHVKYRTQDELRISQVRPDIQNFMRNSSLEKYPHHEQYYGQQDKIIDSERFSANLFGQLIRVGNTEYQRQEYATDTDEKESGDLVTINDDAYYVIATENEYYPDVIMQKVTYSKNFNQLSKIVTIPSEPRFYEVSERSKIRREVRLMDFLELTTTKPTQAIRPRFLSNNKWKALIKGVVFNKQAYTLPNFAYTKFVADYKRNHTGSSGQYVAPEQLFPSSDIDRTGANGVIPKEAQDHSECIVSLLYFPLHDGIVFEWDMEDNFKAGDYIDPEISGVNEKGEAYLAQQSHRYVDVLGRADLFTFRLFSKSNWTRSQAQQLPKAVTIPTEIESDICLPSPYLIGLDKDNREALSFNYQINLLHRPTQADIEDFFTFPNLFGKKDSPLKMCFLNEPQSLFNENINLSPALVLADNITYELIDDARLNAIEVRIATPSGIDMAQVKSIVLYQEDEIGGRYAYIVKNVSRLPDSQKTKSWWISPVYAD